MRTTHERHEYWSEKVRDVLDCAADCPPEGHIRTIRYLLTEAYEEGRADERRAWREANQ